MGFLTRTANYAYHPVAGTESVRYLNIFFSVLFAVAFLMFLVTSNVRLAFNTVELYEFGFNRHNVASTTGLTDAQLSEAATQIRDYFNSSEDLLDVRVSVGGNLLPLFDQREVLHMRDVKELVDRTYRVQEGSFLYMLVFATLGFLSRGSVFATYLRHLINRSTVATIVAIVGAGVGATVGFALLFRLFHELSFNNDLWQLDPRTSFLLQMFPQGFWLEATLLVGVATVVEAGLLVGLIKLARLWQARNRRIAQSKMPQYL